MCSVKATEITETEIMQEDDTLDRLVMQKNNMKFSLQDMEESPEKEKLQKKYEALCAQLKEMGVSDHITEDIELVYDNGISVCKASAPDWESVLGTVYNVDSYYQYVTVDGTQYTLYKVVVTDKTYRNLSYVYGDQIILNGKITDENAAKQFALSTVKFTAGLAANAIPNPFVGAAVSSLISAIPDYKPSYIVHGSNVLDANSISVHESVMYIYGYDEGNDTWWHLCSRDYAAINYTLSLLYMLDGKEKRVHSDYSINIIPDKGGKTQVQLVECLLERSENPYAYDPVDYLGTSVSLYLSNSSGVKATFRLHGTLNPYYLK